MGLDIDYLVEKKQDGAWKYQPDFNDFFNDRSYDLFAMYGYGHYRVEDSDIVPISEIRGLPADASESLMAEAAAYADEEDFATRFNFFTLAELQNYHWDETYTDRTGEKQTYREGAWSFLLKAMPPLTELAGDDPESVRLITYLPR